MSAIPSFKIGLIQLSCGPDPEKNLAHALDRVREAAGRGAQVICLPELFRTQYFCQREDPSLFDLAESIPGPTTERVAEVANKLGVAIVASVFEKRAPGI
ncbi:MAG: nitrilase-related carbon-nitrogen hydrolase, partial [Burkholderiales bacterium]